MESVIKRPDGTRIKIEARFYIGSRGPVYDTTVTLCLPGKRKFNKLYSGDDWHYRRLSLEDRAAWVEALKLQVVTPEELHAAKLALWETLKPA